MKPFARTHLALTLIAILALAACTPAGVSPLPPLQAPTTAAPSSTAAQAPTSAPTTAPEAQLEQPTAAAPGLANPASQNCVVQGGTLKIEARGDGGQVGVCYFEDNRQCEEWALMRGQCPAGGVKVTGYATDAARYCAITGGTYAITANSGQPGEQGACALPTGNVCDASDYYGGKCDASTAAPEPTEAATTGLTLKPATMEVCDGMAQALAQALSQAATPPTPIEVTQSETAMTDPSNGAKGTGCGATAKGTGQQFASPDAVLKQITAVLTGGGWKEDPMLAAGGPTGAGSGYRSGDLVSLAGVIWLPDASANCPQDQPISACDVKPEQQLYAITLDTAQTVGMGGASMPNPASQNCAAQGGSLTIEKRADGSEYGVCSFGDNMQCEEWALMRGECPVGGVKVTGYTTPAATFCAISGGTYAVTGNAGQDNERGTCTLPDGKQCEAWSFYLGGCDPAVIGMANPASKNCVALGGESKTQERPDGGQYGVCYFGDNMQCDEWALLRGQCPAGGVKVTGYTTPAAVYCAITGGQYAATGANGQVNEQGTCTLPDGSQCDVWSYYQGGCEPAGATQ